MKASPSCLARHPGLISGRVPTVSEKQDSNSVMIELNPPSPLHEV